MTQQYQELTEQLAALVDAEWPMVSNLANAAALLYERLDRLNWAGFYLTDNHVLWLGPFQGKTACVRIAEGNGVCGTALPEERAHADSDGRISALLRKSGCHQQVCGLFLPTFRATHWQPSQRRDRRQTGHSLR